MKADSSWVTVVITCSIKPDKVEAARRELESVIQTVIATEPACGGIRVHEDPKDPRRLLIIERWESEDAFTGAHVQTPHMQTFMKTAEAFLDGPADFGFWRETIVAS